MMPWWATPRIYHRQPHPTRRAAASQGSMGRRKPDRGSVERRRTSLPTHQPTGLPINQPTSLPQYEPGSRPPEIKDCTYPLGHVRQDVYTCRTCTPGFAAQEAAAKVGVNGLVGLTSVEKIAGFCRGCRTECHSRPECDVIDIYSKRGFRCDCGNNRMNNTCNLHKNKPAPAQKNKDIYNHNFVGKYCRCDKGCDGPGEMMQCVVCEDWFHESCLRMPNGLNPADCDLENIKFEFLCRGCAKKLPFLEDYFADRGLFQPERSFTFVKPVSQRSELCKRPREVVKGALKGRDMFWSQGFRSKFCRCRECFAMYGHLKCKLLVDRKDFISQEGVNDADFKLVIPHPDQVVRDVMTTSERRRAGVHEASMFSYDEDLTEDAESRKRSRESAFGGTTKSLPDDHQEYIHKRVASFLTALSEKQHGKEVSAEDIERTLAQMRSEIVKGETVAGPI